MDYLLSPDSRYLWTAILALTLFYPVRQLIWVTSVRRLERREGDSDETRRQSLKRRANVTAALLCFVFAFFYTGYMLQAGP
ncbi:MAG: hypothetical protein GY791_13455 [Alphaproteobacteria bacterium]|nr:hypothetical protein [Alphaproteobacteria bacterium]